jgi:hypothetical protein
MHFFTGFTMRCVCFVLVGLVFCMEGKKKKKCARIRRVIFSNVRSPKLLDCPDAHHRSLLQPTRARTYRLGDTVETHPRLRFDTIGFVGAAVPGSAQFFITLGEHPSALHGKHSALGRIAGDTAYNLRGLKGGSTGAWMMRSALCDFLGGWTCTLKE